MAPINPLEELKRCVAKAGSQKKAAAILGVSQQFVSDALTGRRPVPPSILRALGLEVKTTIVRRKDV